MYGSVHRAFGNLSHFTGKLVAGGEFQTTVFGCQRDPRGFNQRNGFLTIDQAQRFFTAVGDDSDQLCAARQGQFDFVVDRAGRDCADGAC